MKENSIIVENLIKTFKAPKNFKNKSNLIYALNNISFSLEKGQILGIIGKNGSGKTTLLRTISGIYNATSGNITVNGKLAPVLQIGIGFRNEISCVENIIMYGLLLGLQKNEIKNKINSILEFADLKDFARMKLKYFSSGMRTRLAFATAMQIKSEIFLVDEILAVGDMDFKQKSFDEFMRLKKEGKTIIHTTHNLSAVERFSDKVLFLDKGKQIDIGEPKEIVTKYKKYILGE
ncbi:MAG: ATP-binding cassette domain-containing protein [Nitrosopumilus sp.]|nr:ATP-binding cassette domain-containing protein [Nitrosopumilus sp.]MDH3764478.1 ATP-binding cassette domain-containing protein [Nitrosopumilus sp.]